MVNNSAENLKLVHIASGDLWAGAEIQLFTLAKQLVNTPDIRLTVVLFNYGELECQLLAHNVSVYIIDEKKFNGIIIFKKLLSLLRDIDPDIVHTHRTKENILGSIAAKLGGVKQTVRTVHGAPEHKPPFWKIWKYIYLWLDVLCGKYLQSNIVAVSSDLNCLLQPIFSRRVITIENGVDIDAISTSSKILAIPGNKQAIKICIVCRLVPVKRVDLFIEMAIKFLNKYNDAVEFYIFGDGPLTDECNRLIDRSGISDRIYMMGFQDNMSAWMGNMDVLMITSDHEGLPMNLLEAMSLQLPVISHAVGGITKVLGDGEYGILVKNQDIDEYVAALQKYVNNDKLYIKKAAAGHEFIKSNYSASKNSAAYIKLYRTLMGQNK